MNWNDAATEWRGFRGEVRAHWRRLTDLQIETIAGRRTCLRDEIRTSYGLSIEEAERQILSFEARSDYFRAVSSR